MGRWVVGTRPTNSITDLLLSFELTVLLVLWLRERAHAEAGGRVKWALYKTYAVNLAGAAAWCAIGVYVHLLEPLPRARTASWMAFLLTGAATPVLFPLVLTRAFQDAETQPRVMMAQDAMACTVAVGYGSLAWSGVDLAGGRALPSIPVTPWHQIDGRSYAGEQYGVQFDLLSSMPTAQSDSNFVLSVLFFASNFLCIMLLLRSCWRLGGKRAGAPDPVERRLQTSARRLALLVTTMLANCHTLAALLAAHLCTVVTALDLFHIAQGLIILGCFTELRRVLRQPGPKAA